MRAQPRRVLVLGDSTALGIGTGQPLRGIPYWIEAEFPHAKVVVRAVSESLVHDLPRQFPRDGKLFDAVLIICGGLDVLHFTPVRRLAATLREVVGLARERAPLVIVANSANLGAAALFQWPLNALLSKRSLKVAEVFRNVCQELDVAFVNFSFPRGLDPFGQDPQRYFAEDGIHPSAEAYALCYRIIRSRTPLREVLTGMATSAAPASRSRGERTAQPTP